MKTAIGFIRRDIPGHGTDLHTLAHRHGYRVVFTVITDTGPVISGMIVAQHLCEYAADAVVVPGYEHAETIRCLITDLAALITPMRVYPLGYRWPGFDRDSRP
ncbi:hypothetical protein [Nocardia sp. NPDC051750]|uniref:hypothetical protein n=1 Tax=Nocardia sp. NPDC051750 TaxID=3364325 RepID=UPI0037AECD92